MAMIINKNEHKHSYLAAKLHEKSGMPDNNYWDKVQDRFDHSREERLEHMGPILGKAFNTIMIPFDWRKADKKQHEEFIHSPVETKSFEEREKESRVSAFKEVEKHCKEIGIDFDDLKSKGESQIQEREKNESESDVAKLAKKLWKEAKGAASYDCVGAGVNRATKSLDSLLKTAKTAGDEEAIKLIKETKSALKNSDLDTRSEFKILETCYNTLQGSNVSEKPNTSILSIQAKELWSDAKRAASYDCPGAGVNRAEKHLDSLMDVAGKTKNDQAITLIKETKSALKNSNLDTGSKFNILETCYDSIIQNDFKGISEDKKSQEYNSAKPPMEEILPLDENNLQASFRESAFKMSEAQGGPSAVELEKWRQNGLNFVKKREKEKAFWKALGLD